MSSITVQHVVVPYRFSYRYSLLADLEVNHFQTDHVVAQPSSVLQELPSGQRDYLGCPRLTLLSVSSYQLVETTSLYAAMHRIVVEQVRWLV